MKKTVKVVPILATLALMVSTVVLADAVPGKPFALVVGETVEVDGMTLQFTQVRNDGRCPVGVYCFWEGDAACMLWATVPGTGERELVVHTSDFFGRSVTYAGRTITLLKLYPYPVYEEPPPAPESYVVTLVVTEDESVTPVEETTWSRIKALYQ